MKTGRNQPYPCGSGKKYKKCCLEKDGEQRPVDLRFYQVRDAFQKLTDKLLNCFDETFGPEALVLAMGEFYLWPEELPEESVLERHWPLFAAWLYFTWFLDLEEAESEGLEIDAPGDLGVAEALMDGPGGKKLSPLEASLLDAGLDCPISYWEVVGIHPDGGVDMRDILTTEKFTLHDSTLPGDLIRGDVLYGQLLHFDDIAFLAAAAPAVFPPSCKTEILRVRDAISGGAARADPGDVAIYQIELRELYFSLLNMFQQPSTLVNHDGDLLSMHKIRYRIDSPELAFERLHTLSVTQSRQEMLEHAGFADDGVLNKVEITWDREEHDHPQGWTNTILGRIDIDGDRLIVEVNSAERAEKIRAKIESRLGTHAVHKGTSLQSPESLLRQGAPGLSAGDEPIDLEAVPEMREALMNMIASHWRGWIDTEIPALQGATPRNTVKTMSGREAVEVLLLDAERVVSDDETMRTATHAALRETRQTLGLE